MNLFKFRFISQSGQSLNSFAIAESLERAIEIMKIKNKPLVITEVVMIEQ